MLWILVLYDSQTFVGDCTELVFEKRSVRTFDKRSTVEVDILPRKIPFFVQILSLLQESVQTSHHFLQYPYFLKLI